MHVPRDVHAQLNIKVVVFQGIQNFDARLPFQRIRQQQAATSKRWGFVFFCTEAGFLTLTVIRRYVIYIYVYIHMYIWYYI